MILANSNGHQLYQDSGVDAPDSIKDRNGEIVLGLCKLCNRGEIELEEPCDKVVVVPQDFLSNERKRIEIIKRAVEAAQEVLDEYIDPTPDVTAYLLYKTGGNLLMLGMEHLDKRVFISDLTGMTQVKATFEAIVTPEPQRHAIAKCRCGRRLDQLERCSGCYKSVAKCSCVRLKV